MESNRIKRHIDRVLLDPNNYRFIDRPEYKFVPDENIGDLRIQKRTQNLLQGSKNENISDLISSFKSNGFLDIEQIQVKPLGEYHVVLEGNRRIATLKHLYEEYKNSNDVGLLELSDFKSVDLVEITEEDPVQHLITMGLHHISGKKRWRAVNEAQLIDDLIKKYGKTEEDICNSLGINKHNLRRSRRTLSLIQDYKNSDYGDQFEANMYSIFETVISSTKMKQWIEWNDYYYRADNSVNIERFYSWISESEETHTENETDTENEKEVRLKREPIITQYRQVKEVAKFLDDETALSRMEESRSIAEGYTFSDAVGEIKLRDAINSIKAAIQLAGNYRELIDFNLHEDLVSIKSNVESLIPDTQGLIVAGERRTNQYFEETQSQFNHVHIESYRKLKNIEITHLKQVNIFAGGNNTGKTSMLEAFYLVSQLNDVQAFLDLERYRGKFLNEFHAKWIEKNFIGDVEINGSFNHIPVSLYLQKASTEEDIERMGYLNTLTATANVGRTEYDSYIHLFSNKEPQLRYSETRVLCRAAFTSPYRYNQTLIRLAHEHAVDNQYLDEIIEFIRENLDKDIKKIDLVNGTQEGRFRVTASNGVMDITKYGEGLQRVFEIALLLGYCRNGILCIDEIDSALHYSLLVKFTGFIQRAAARFNVQVFLSTHSKECIDAFVENDYPDDNLMAFALTEENGAIACRFLEGNKLKQLVESIDIDIR